MKGSFLLKTVSIFLVVATLLQSIPCDFFHEGRFDLTTLALDLDLESQKDAEDKKSQSELEDTKEQKHPHDWAVALLSSDRQENPQGELHLFDPAVMEIISPPPEQRV